MTLSASATHVNHAVDTIHVDAWLAEDVGPGDITTNAILDTASRVTAHWLAKSDGVVAGLAEAEAVFRQLDPNLSWNPTIKDGAVVTAGTDIVTFEGQGRAILTAERTALNIAQRMSGIATAARRYANAVAHYPARILDTRKTAPGLRHLDKKAVALGGGVNHRVGLHDLAMIKDNHIVAAGSIAAAVNAVRSHAPGVRIEVETTTLDEVEQALAASVDMIMLDNMTPATMTEAVRRIAGRATVEASGNVEYDTVSDIAATGVDFISVGALTHSVRAFDISQRIDHFHTADIRNCTQGETT